MSSVSKNVRVRGDNARFVLASHEVHGPELEPDILALCKQVGRGEPDGDATLMIEWSWRIERPRSILGGSWSSERRWPGIFRRLVGNTVSGVEFFGTLPEIIVSLSNGLRVVSFMTAEGQPAWAVIARRPALGSLCVERGRLKVEAPQPADDGDDTRS